MGGTVKAVQFNKSCWWEQPMGGTVKGVQFNKSCWWEQSMEVQ